MLLALLAPAAAGCSGMLLASGGVAVPFSGRDGHTAVATEINAGWGYENVGVGLAARGKFGASLAQAALAPELYVLGGGDLVGFARAGVHLFQFESLATGFAFGAGSPYLTVGAALRVGRLRLALATGVEYDVRFDDHPNDAYWTVTLGVGLAGTRSSEQVSADTWNIIQPRPQPR